MNADEEFVPTDAEDFFSLLVDSLDAKFPARNIGEDAGYVLLEDEYVSRDNKRRIVFFVVKGPAAMTRVEYIMAVDPPFSGLFRQRTPVLLPATPATFTEMAIPAGETAAHAADAWAAANNFTAWDAETARMAAQEQTPVTRGYLRYWRTSRKDLYAAIDKTAIALAEAASAPRSPAPSDPIYGRSSSRSSGSRRVTVSSSRQRTQSRRRSTPRRRSLSARQRRSRSRRKTRSAPERKKRPSSEPRG